MDFELTEAQAAIADLAGTILTERCTHERISALEGWFDRGTWLALAEAGLLGIALPEAHGGGGLGLVELHLLLERVGMAAAPLPAWETLGLAAPAIAQFGDPALRSQILPGVAAGATILTAALVDDPHAPLLQPATTAQGQGDQVRLTGTKSAVPCGALADLVLVSASHADGSTLVAVVDPSTAGASVTAQDAIDGSPTARLDLDEAAVVGVLGDGRTLRWLLDRARVTVASVQSGLCQAALRMAATHTSQREQFGRPIATFQAVAHRVADAFIDAEGARLTSLEAAWRLAEGLPSTEAVDVAAWWGATAGHTVLHAVHHVHGGTGVDQDYPLHRYYRLTKRLEFALGGASEHLRSLGATLASRPA